MCLRVLACHGKRARCATPFPPPADTQAAPPPAVLGRTQPRALGQVCAPSASLEGHLTLRLGQRPQTPRNPREPLPVCVARCLAPPGPRSSHTQRLTLLISSPRSGSCLQPRPPDAELPSARALASEGSRVPSLPPSQPGLPGASRPPFPLFLHVTEQLCASRIKARFSLHY